MPQKTCQNWRVTAQDARPPYFTLPKTRAIAAGDFSSAETRGKGIRTRATAAYRSVSGASGRLCVTIREASRRVSRAGWVTVLDNTVNEELQMKLIWIPLLLLLLPPLSAEGHRPRHEGASRKLLIGDEELGNPTDEQGDSSCVDPGGCTDAIPIYKQGDIGHSGTDPVETESVAGGLFITDIMGTETDPNQERLLQDSQDAGFEQLGLPDCETGISQSDTGNTGEMNAFGGVSIETPINAGDPISEIDRGAYRNPCEHLSGTSGR